MELMRHSDRRLSDHLYTDTALLPVREAVEKLPSSFGELPHILPHDLVPNGLSESHRGAESDLANQPGSGLNKGVFQTETHQVPRIGEVGPPGFEPGTKGL